TPTARWAASASSRRQENGPDWRSSFGIRLPAGLKTFRWTGQFADPQLGLMERSAVSDRPARSDRAARSARWEDRRLLRSPPLIQARRPRQWLEATARLTHRPHARRP